MGQDRQQVAETLQRKLPRYRIDIIEMLTEAGSGHPGGSLSAIDVLATLYHYKLRHRPQQPDWPERDRLVLERCRRVGLPVAVVMAGGYARQIQDTVDIHLATVRLCASRAPN